MSQYPYGYGFQGQQPQQQYSYQPYGAYSAAPGYGAQQPQQPQQHQQHQQHQQPQQPQHPPPTTGNYYAATQSAYDYNANNIPGLGAPPAGPRWDQSGYGTTSVSAQYSPYIPVSTTSTPASYTNKQTEAPASRDPDPLSQYRQDQSRVQTKAPQIQRLAEQPKQQSKDVDSQEEGEISDGQFDDLYDDLSNQPSDPHLLTVASASGKSSEDGVATGTDQEPNFYETDVEELPAFKSQPTVTSRGKALGGDVALAQTEPSRVERDRSRSYSPYLSPREVEQDIAIPENAEAGSGTQQLVYRGVNEASAGYDQHAGQKVHAADRREEDEVASKGPTAARTTPRPFKTLSEAQNEAKKTILRLLPLGVKYQTYIDEGIDQNVVKDLFVQLNLAPPAPSSMAPEKPVTTLEQNTPGPKKPPTETTQADDKAKQQEERKDKIARLLAEKKAKAAAAAGTASKAPVTPVSAGTSSPSIKPKTQSEKNLLLQQKMEALRKAQEARAQKANQQPAAAQVSKPEVVEKDMARPAAEENTATAHSAADPISTAAKPVPVAQNLPHDGSGTTSVPVQPTFGIQSPVLPSPLAKPGTQRKRPVAADFVDYPSPAIKRPFLPSRQDSSLVISVSDDEDDDDDDVDMEVVSPAEDSSASAQQSFNSSRGGPSLRDYPPLTNRGAQRQLSSPAPGTPNGRITNVDLQAQERAIADLKRRIEEAEARKKAKPKTGSSTPQTPSAGNVTPIDQGAKQSARRAVSTSELDDKNGPSAQLLHEAEAAKLPKDLAASQVDERPESERRSPPSSAQISNVTAIDAKVARIKQMEEELKSLRAEVEKTMAEQIRPEVGQPGSDSAADFVADNQPIPAAPTPSGDSDRMQLDDNSFDAASQSHPMEIESSEESSDEMETVPKTPQGNSPEVLADIATNGVEGSAQDFGSVDPVQPSIAGQSAEAPSAIAATPLTGDVVSAAEEDASDDYEPPDAQPDDRPAADSPPFSPAPAEDASSLEASQREAQDLISPIPMPTQISTAKMPNDDPATEAHAEFFSHPSSRVEEIPREDADNAAPTPQTSFVDYESPLRYFHAYRFHPAYNHSVAGGLKSLTYSNRIDPKREVCPDELDGQKCPRGSACQFQHFQNMTAPDNLIILELGSSDDLIGDQKKNFNNGLRELVSSFQKSKVRDFRTIAEGIVEFRRRFLGDPTRILHLEGVTI